MGTAPPFGSCGRPGACAISRRSNPRPGDAQDPRRDCAPRPRQAGLKLVGFDYLSIDRFGSADFPAHHALLEAGVVVVEGLDLSGVEPGEYDMACLPLRVGGGDASPARVILRSRA